MRATDILKAIQKLNPAEKHRLREYLINGVATKYSDNYLTWFQVLESVQHQRNEVTLKDLIIKGNLIQNTETYRTLRLSKFTI